MKKRVVIVGGGTAGWMTAAAISCLLKNIASVRLIESADIPTVGVGEATLPHLRAFLLRLGIDEAEFMKATQATYKLGIEFRDFGAIGDRYIHPFGSHGEELAGVGFHHYWLRALREGHNSSIDSYSLGAAAAIACRFEATSDDADIAAGYGYAYQFDATLFAPFLRDLCIARGVVRTEATVSHVVRDRQSGDIATLRLDTGEAVDGDLFIDCTGFASLLLGGALEEPWIDWSHWLPCDRAAAMATALPEGDIPPYTTATAMPAGWRWRIPLRHRAGNGYVYASSALTDDEACAAIRMAAPGEPLADPRILRFRPGRRRRSWRGNTVAIGLSSGFLEPLESTSLYLVQVAITLLIELFPIDGIDNGDRVEFNRLIDMEYDRARDFVILHYHATRRNDTPFWNHVRTMDIPDTLAEKIALWRRTGRVHRYTEGLFFEPSWVAVYVGQGLLPETYDPRADIPPGASLSGALDRLRQRIDGEVAAMPRHADYLHQQEARLAAC